MKVPQETFNLPRSAKGTQFAKHRNLVCFGILGICTLTGFWVNWRLDQKHAHQRLIQIFGEKEEIEQERRMMMGAFSRKSASNLMEQIKHQNDPDRPHS